MYLCEYCKNNKNGCKKCKDCESYDPEAGRQACIKVMKRDYGIQTSAIFRNVVHATPVTLFKDLCRFKGVTPSIANKITTTESTNEKLQELGSDYNDETLKAFVSEVSQLLTDDDYEEFSKCIDKLDYVSKMNGVVYGTSIHASGTILAEYPIDLPVSPHSGDIHYDGANGEKLGFVKQDLLSLSNLDAMSEIMGVDIDYNDGLDSFDPNKDRYMRTLVDEPNDFIFQLGSSTTSGMISKAIGEDKDISKLDVDAISDISAINRPGPLGLGLNDIWADNRQGIVNHGEDAISAIDEIKRRHGK